MKSDHFNYSISWRSKNYRYGNNLSSKIGNDFEYSGSKNFNDHPDLSSIDIKNSITNPYEHIFVKTYNLNNPINLIVLCDISSSIFATKENDSIIKKIAKIIALSAIEHGDLFSMLCYNDDTQNNFYIEPNNNIQFIYQWINKLTFVGDRTACEKVENIVKQMPSEKSLVFWISDFHLSHDHINKMLDQLSNHHVIPIYLSTENEIKSLPNYGFRSFIDSELNEEREIFLRPKVKDQLLLDYKESKRKILQMFSRKQLRELEVDSNFNLNDIQKYFMSTVI